MLDLSKSKFSKLRPIKYIAWNNKWECLCDCGNTRIVSENSLIRGYAKSCGCSQRRKVYPSLIGQKFHKLTVQKEAISKRGAKAWECLCECGNLVILETASILQGNNLSCGNCIRKKYSDLSGTTIKYWKILNRTTDTKAAKYLCECVCGKQKEIERAVLMRKTFIGHCGCIDKARRTEEQKQRNMLRKNRYKIILRDNSTCQLCGCNRRTYKLKVHHILPFKENESERLNTDNLITLCSKCHTKVHGGCFNRISTTFQKILSEIITWTITDKNYKPITYSD